MTVRGEKKIRPQCRYARWKYSGTHPNVFSRGLKARARSPGSGSATGVGAIPSSMPRSPSPAISRASRPGPEGPTAVVA